MEKEISLKAKARFYGLYCDSDGGGGGQHKSCDHYRRVGSFLSPELLISCSLFDNTKLERYDPGSTSFRCGKCIVMFGKEGKDLYKKIVYIQFEQGQLIGRILESQKEINKEIDKIRRF